MLYSQVRVPIEIVNDERVTKDLWYKMSEQLMKTIGYETNYVLCFKKKIEQEYGTPYVILTLTCDVTHTATNVHTTVAKTFEIPMELKVKRIERLKQFIFGK